MVRMRDPPTTTIARKGTTTIVVLESHRRGEASWRPRATRRRLTSSAMPAPIVVKKMSARHPFYLGERVSRRWQRPRARLQAPAKTVSHPNPSLFGKGRVVLTESETRDHCHHDHHCHRSHCFLVRCHQGRRATRKESKREPHIGEECLRTAERRSRSSSSGIQGACSCAGGDKSDEECHARMRSEEGGRREVASFFSRPFPLLCSLLNLR
jgi:hypothetical protein